ncbi:MAG TPA: ferrochelatase [Sulfurimonas sp.]|nr:ferrochelatase [Sulfurimonas sp.]
MAKEAIILLNMGGPNNLTEVEMFLTNMFNDENILTMKSGILRKFIATMITFFRTESSQEIYRELGGKSPIVGHTKKLVSDLQKALPKVYIDYVMRYTPPFAPEVIDRLKEKGIEKIFLVPLYPQYSTTTTKSSLEDFEKAFHNSGLDAILVEKKHYYELSKYNDAVIERVVEGLGGDKSEDYHLIFSAHGLPQKIVDAGDPYQRHVERHVDLLKEKLKEKNVNFKFVNLAYQSKVGLLAWLKPSLETVLDKTRNENVLIYPIAFTIDNSETDFELSIEYKEIAEELGFKKFKVGPCVNNHPLFVDALVELYEKMKFD